MGFDQGAHLLLRRELALLPVGGRLAVAGTHEALVVHLAAWCRREGHELLPGDERDGQVRAWVVRGRAGHDRWAGAERAGGSSPAGLVARPPAHWGLAARGALVESGGCWPGCTRTSGR